MTLRLWPRSLLGQMLLSVALALLAAQAISATLLYRAQEERREETLMNAAALRLIAPDDNSPARFHDRDRGGHLAPPRGGPFRIRLTYPAGFSPKATDKRYPKWEEGLGAILTREGYAFTNVIVVTRKLGDDALALERLRQRDRFRDDPYLAERKLLLVGVQSGEDGTWTVARIPVPEREPRAFGTLIGQTLFLYIVLVGGMALLLRRITRPLAQLTERVEHFARTRELDGQIEPDGPDDMRRLILAQNSMEMRIAALLDEKDVMLGAIGHDLKTPLAALRVRIESVENETQRARMATTIEDITDTLDDILSLARVGRPSDQPENTEIAALTASVVEEFEDMGENVELADTKRIALCVRPTWLRRALRNLISNALRYGGGVARVSLVRDDKDLIIRVEDDGPGIPESELHTMLEPFHRGESSRNRETGGAGLGLTLARAIAEQHGGSLKLSNRRAPDGNVSGLRADIRLPVA